MRCALHDSVDGRPLLFKGNLNSSGVNCNDFQPTLFCATYIQRLTAIRLMSYVHDSSGQNSANTAIFLARSPFQHLVGPQYFTRTSVILPYVVTLMSLLFKFVMGLRIPRRMVEAFSRSNNCASHRRVARARTRSAASRARAACWACGAGTRAAACRTTSRTTTRPCCSSATRPAAATR